MYFGNLKVEIIIQMKSNINEWRIAEWRKQIKHDDHGQWSLRFGIITKEIEYYIVQ